MSPEQFSLPLTLLLFGGGAIVIAVVGSRLTRLADRLSDLTGLGEAVFGAVLLGATTSLPGSVASFTTALAGRADLAVSNAVGGIAAQTAFLVIADIVYRHANLEHAAASVTNLINGGLLVALLALPLLAATGPEIALWGIHPASLLILIVYVFGLKLATATKNAPGWRPVLTAQTFEDEPDEDPVQGHTAWSIWVSFIALALIVAVAGWAVGVSGIALVRHTGLSETLIGSLFTAVATSLPELVTAVAAVRQGALTLAVGGIIGGNTFDVLFVVVADVAYRDGSIYHAISDQPLFIISLTILLTAFLLLGMIRRERSGMGNIGFESVAVLLFYLAGMATLVLW
jgi:cation:H+ antiporter